MSDYRRYKKITWSKYRKIPNYDKTINHVSNYRNEIILFIAEILNHSDDLEKVKSEVAESAIKLAISFDEALYYRWQYCFNLHKVTEQIKEANVERLMYQ